MQGSAYKRLVASSVSIASGQSWDAPTWPHGTARGLPIAREWVRQRGRATAARNDRATGRQLTGYSSPAMGAPTILGLALDVSLPEDALLRRFRALLA